MGGEHMQINQIHKQKKLTYIKTHTEINVNKNIYITFGVIWCFYDHMLGNTSVYTTTKVCFSSYKNSTEAKKNEMRTHLSKNLDKNRHVFRVHFTILYTK